jgi:hypothetical protein
MTASAPGRDSGDEAAVILRVCFLQGEQIIGFAAATT